MSDISRTESAMSTDTLNSLNGSNGTNMGNSPQSRTPQPQSKTNNEGWQEIGLYCYNENDLKDKKYHIARFNNKNNVDIIKDFNKPVRLHRKDPRNLQFHLSRKEIEMKKREDQEKAAEKAMKRQQRLAGIPVEDEDDEEDVKPNGDSANSSDSERKGEIDLSQIAPEGGARNIRKNMFKRKTRRINLMNDDQRKLRYEEYYPWVMEDYDGKNVYVGNYEAGATETTQVLFVFDSNGFKMVPVEKVYRFNPRNKYATLTLEEAEAKMEKKSAVPRWLMKHMEDENSNGNDYRYKANNGPDVNGPKIHAASASSRFANRSLRTVTGGSSSNNDRDSDHDDIDFDEEFADDEEAPIIDGDEEENKLSEQKIKREMLKAAHFDGGGEDVDNAEDDLDDLFETEKSRKIDKEGKKLRKVLNKTEGGVYDSDDEDDNLNPYLSKSDLESGEEDDDDDEVVFKQEYDSNALLSSTRPRQFFGFNYGEGFVVIKAPSPFLSQFPKGEWITNGRKRPIKQDESPNKKIKVESPQSPKEATGSPPPLGDLNDAGPDGSLVTVGEVLDILRNNPLTTKELLIRLRTRVNANKENKSRIISIVKTNLRLSDGKLVLKE